MLEIDTYWIIVNGKPVEVFSDEGEIKPVDFLEFKDKLDTSQIEKLYTDKPHMSSKTGNKNEKSTIR